jgi:hypothetical protein
MKRNKSSSYVIIRVPPKSTVGGTGRQASDTPQPFAGREEVVSRANRLGDGQRLAVERRCQGRVSVTGRR